ncbi:Na(+)/H(+) exchange regulatory cofactor NHE-RF1 [Culicoides brevitarsis]|uniref:Na(+)/H(+) exchange regulatory cofactor NHE-RF1 n=1 Tax=Culicoides brevitarsis TaxID=469753 RepID=UPI00307C9FD8
MAEIATKSTPRKITIRKRDDFDGYGFNLHAEKGKPGQYVGKVDADSPAELAGLREGDRIIEVNGIDIGSETHKQVVERIKAVPHETTLLVIDPHSFSLTKNGSMSPVAKKEEKQVEKNRESMNNNNNNDATTDSDNKKTGTKDNSAVSANATTTTTAENNNTKVANATVMISETTESTKTETGNHHANNHHTQKTTTTTTTTTTTEKPAENNNHDKNHENNSNQANGKHTDSKTSNGSSAPALNLNMTATELRAKLMAKKKYDPKNDSIDLRKKHDIIEKM